MGRQPVQGRAVPRPAERGGTGWSTPRTSTPPASTSRSWFKAPDYPANLPAIWDKYWGYLYKQNIAPIMMGEFGSTWPTRATRCGWRT